MPHIITQSCCSDGSCVYACPVNCIHPSPDEPGFDLAARMFGSGLGVTEDPATGSAAAALIGLLYMLARDDVERVLDDLAIRDPREVGIIEHPTYWRFSLLGLAALAALALQSDTWKYVSQWAGDPGGEYMPPIMSSWPAPLLMNCIAERGTGRI